MLPLLKEYSICYRFLSFFTWSGRGYVTFTQEIFGLQGACLFAFVFGFQEETIPAGCFLIDLFCEGWLWYVLCVVV